MGVNHQKVRSDLSQKDKTNRDDLFKKDCEEVMKGRKMTLYPPEKKCQVDPNKRFAELAGLKCPTCGGLCRYFMPNFTDAREVLKVMMGRDDWKEFLLEIGDSRFDFVPASLVVDTTGLMRDEAIKFLEEKGA